MKRCLQFWDPWNVRLHQGYGGHFRCNSESGGEGSWTPVLVAVRANIYTFIRREFL